MPTVSTPLLPSLADVQPATVDDLLDLAQLAPRVPLRLVCTFGPDETSDAALAYRARMPLAERVDAVRAAVPDVADEPGQSEGPGVLRSGEPLCSLYGSALSVRGDDRVVSIVEAGVAVVDLDRSSALALAQLLVEAVL